MMTEKIKELLNKLSEAEAYVDTAHLKKQEAIDGVLTPEIKMQLDAIDVDFDGNTEHAREEINKLRDAIKDAVEAHGSSVKGPFRHAIFSRRTKWDGKKLDGFAMAHPEILDAKTESTSVSIRKVK